MLTLIAAGLTFILARGIFVLVSPYRECRWCRGKPRRRGCWRCNGKRLTRRFGAYHVHKVKLSLLQAWDEREWWR